MASVIVDGETTGIAAIEPCPGIAADEVDEEGIDELRKCIQVWWETEKIPDDFLKARVVLIFKKGNSADISNYRPISLLNTITKLFAAILKKRIEAGTENLMNKTQFGFRKNESTSHAILFIRRIIDLGERKRSDSRTIRNNPIALLLLDWEKTFDKITHRGLHDALERMDIPLKLRNRIKELYKHLQFKIEIEGNASEWKKQHTGIRQGCPLSPYLFLIL